MTRDASSATTRRTPMMDQYLRMKAENPDAILFFRMGDFYETFLDDAPVVAKTLGITLTARDKDANGDRVPLAGFPHHALDSYLYKMVQAGHKVAICEQIENPKLAKGVVKRAIIRVVTPGTLADPKVLEVKVNHFIVAILTHGRQFGVACCDLSTGEFLVTEFDSPDEVIAEMTRLEPRELIVSESFRHSELLAAVDAAIHPAVNRLSDWQFDHSTARSVLLEHFEMMTLDGFGCEHLPVAVGAAGALMSYLKDTQKNAVQHITAMSTYSTKSFMTLDADTIRNLELVRTMRDGSRRGTLLDILDATLTPMGGRKLRNALIRPLLDVREIGTRLDAVEEFANNRILTADIRELFDGVYDIERLVGRVGLGTANARDLQTLRNSLAVLPRVRERLSGCSTSLLATLRDALDTCDDVVDLIEHAVHPEPPASLREGNLIRDGFNAELDDLRDLIAHGKERIAQLQESERRRTGIASLKVGYNQVFGYYIEITKPNLSNVPDNYTRRQTLANAERFVTPELKEFEEKILNAESRILDLEYALFTQVRDRVRAESLRIQRAAAVIASLDFLSSLAYVAIRNNYAKPVIDEGATIFIRAGRHPVVEQLVTHEGFVPNDTCLNADNEQLHIITGPNMSGKSTYLRQVALITLMAQMGSYVPAAEAHIGVVDRIFTRVGASDNLALGQSTFLVEMSETASILHNATRRSLIVLDEIGRGTSTFDGLSIAWAVAEHILKHVGAKTLFATHYHELVELADHYVKARNYNVAVHEDEDTVTFLRKVVEGGSDQSYGIHVARLAGLPESVIARAAGILRILEQHDISVTDKRTPRARRRIPKRNITDGGLQLSLFVAPEATTDPVADELRAELAALNVDAMTPLEALSLLHALRAKARSES